MANALFGSALFAHNTRVGFLSFATGMLAGVPTILFQVYNGLLVGALGSVFFADPWPFEFLAWILPHGIPEFTAITLCAAAGLLLGGAVALPGRRRRRDTLRDAVEPALLLVGAAIPLFAMAALIESFVRESALATGTRLGVAAAMLAALLATMLYVRRVAMRVEVDTDWLFDSSALRPVANRQVAVQHRRGDRLRREVEGLEPPPAQSSQGHLALAQQVVEDDATVEAESVLPFPAPTGIELAEDAIADGDQQHPVAFRQDRQRRHERRGVGLDEIRQDHQQGALTLSHGEGPGEGLEVRLHQAGLHRPEHLDELSQVRPAAARRDEAAHLPRRRPPSPPGPRR